MGRLRYLLGLGITFDQPLGHGGFLLSRATAILGRSTGLAVRLGKSGRCAGLSAVHLAELAGLEVDKGLVNLLLGVHHERPVANNRLVDRVTAE